MRVQLLLLVAILGGLLFSQGESLCPIPRRADVVFMVDRSGSLLVREFDNQISFITSLMQELDDTGDVQFAALSYSTTASLVFHFNTFTDLADEQNALESLPNPMGESFINLAMDFVLSEDMFSTTNGARTGVPKVVIGFTDGFTRRTDEALQSSQALQAQGINVVLIGAGFDPFIGQCRLEGVASRPQLAYNVANYDDLPTSNLIQELIKPFTTDFLVCADSPCSQMCTDNDDGTFTCSCGSGFTLNAGDCSTCDDIDECSNDPSPCDQICINTVGSFHCSCSCGSAVDPNDVTKCIDNQCNVASDILFVIAATGDSADNSVLFNAVADSLSLYNIADDEVKVGAVIFGEDPQTLFQLTGDAAFAAQQLRNAPELSPDNSGDLVNALNFVNDNDLFSEANGGRAALPDRIILITNDGITGPCRLLPRFLRLLFGNRISALRAAQTLKDNGVDISVLGVGHCLKSDFLAKLASNPLAAVHINDYSDLNEALPLLSTLTCDLADFLDETDLSSLVALKRRGIPWVLRPWRGGHRG